MKKRHKLLYKIFLGASILVPFIVAMTTLYLGKIPFWFDPARDLTMALDNHEKISLIGQTSGIPGIFYGPYWIWFLSLALFVSHDPRIAAFMVLTLPYFILFPFILLKFKKTLGNITPILLWLLFIIAFSEYAIRLWNPHPAPLICLAIIYLLTSHNYKNKQWKQQWKILLAGFFAGLIINLHISFGLAVIIGSGLFLLFSKNRLKTVPLFLFAVFIVFIPFFVFELRHGFNQIKTLADTLTSSSSVVKEVGADKFQVITFFFSRLAMLLQIPLQAAYVVIIVVVLYIAFLYKMKKITFTLDEKKILFLIGAIAIALLGIYLATKNPVWEYHFIGVEILFLLLIGVLAQKSTLIKYILIGWVSILFIVGLIDFVNDMRDDPLKTSSLTTKEHIVKTIYDDAGTMPFTVYIYSPATFTPDFDYLLKWKGKSDNTAKLERTYDAEVIYLIIPWTTKDLKADFIDNRTPNKEYKTVKKWHIADETDILKRVRYEKK